MNPLRHARLGLFVAALACGGPREPAPTTVTLVPREAPPAPAATLTVALPQRHDAPAKAHASRWTPPAPRPRDVAQARSHFADGVRAYAAGDYAKAVTELETAYAYAPVAPVLYNIAVALEKSGRDPEALDVYERYEQTGLPAARAAEVQQRIRALRARLP